MFGRGPNCYLLKSLYSPCCLIRLLTFMLDNVLSSVWESTSDGFFLFFKDRLHFRLQSVFRRTEQAELRAQKDSQKSFFSYYQEM